MQKMADFQSYLAGTPLKGLDRDLAWVPTLPGPNLTMKKNIKKLIFTLYRSTPFYQNFKTAQLISK